MKLVLICDQNPNQVALANKLCSLVETKVIFSRNISGKPSPLFKRISNAILNRTVGKRITDAWIKMQNQYESLYQVDNLGICPVVDNVNSASTLQVAQDFQPQLILISGTNLLSNQTILNLQKLGPVLNLHTGISPYIKGGPNCTNWCLALKKFHLIGNTVMEINSGIDTGNIILTEQTPLTGNEDLWTLHYDVMEHAHRLYLKVVQSFLAGGTLLGVPQEQLGQGETYYSRQWGRLQARMALYHFDHFYNADYFLSNEYREQVKQLKLYSSPDLLLMGKP